MLRLCAMEDWDADVVSTLKTASAERAVELFTKEHVAAATQGGTDGQGLSRIQSMLAASRQYVRETPLLSRLGLHLSHALTLASWYRVPGCSRTWMTWWWVWSPSSLPATESRRSSGAPTTTTLAGRSSPSARYIVRCSTEPGLILAALQCVIMLAVGRATSATSRSAMFWSCGGTWTSTSSR